MGDAAESRPASTMPAAVYQGGGSVTVQDVSVPTPAPHQVLVEVSYCGVCGSDLHLLVEGWGKPGTVAGHEFSGSIAAVGADVTAWAVGDLVVGGPTPRCGECRRCRQGRPSQCEARDQISTEHLGGAFARYVLVHGGSLVRVPPGLAARVAALAEPLAVALHGITQAALADDERVMVVGAGPIGALVAAALVAGGKHHVTVVEPNDRRRQIARDVGVDRVLDPAELTLFAPWEPELIASEAVDAVIECSGKKTAIESALHQLRRGGRLVLVGAGVEHPSFDPNRILLNELEIRGSFVYDADGFERALELLASGALPTGILVEPTDVALDELPAALAGLADGSIAGKVMVVPRPTAALGQR